MKLIHPTKAVLAIAWFHSTGVIAAEADAAGAEGTVPAAEVDPSYTLDNNQGNASAVQVDSAQDAKAAELLKEETKVEAGAKAGVGVGATGNKESKKHTVASTKDTGLAGAEGHAEFLPPVGESSDVKSESSEATSPAVMGESSDGTRIFIEGKGFSIAPPAGWFVRRDLPRTSLFIQAPTKAETEYPRNIAVTKFPGPEFINDVSAEKMSQFIVNNFPKASPEISNYALRNHQSITMNDGREGILFYTDFTVNGRAMMQAHILVSSETAHYLATFTDIAEHFENPQGDNEFLATAWAAMTSIELDSPNPKPMESVGWMAGILAILVVVGGIFAYARHRAATSVYRDYGEMDPGEAAEAEPRTHALDDDQVETESASAVSSLAPVIPFKAKVKDKEQRQDTLVETETAPLSKSEADQWNLNHKSESPTDLGDEPIERDQWKVS